MQDVWVVGDRFAAFATVDGVSTVTDVERLLARLGGTDDVTLRLGQGVGEYERAHVRWAVDRHGLQQRVRIVDDASGRADRHLVHKHRSDNVLLGAVRACGDGFVAPLSLSGHNELLQDHQTGLHVQGMVVVEAVRQMFLAAAELHHGRPIGGRTVVWDRLDLRFLNFLFPLPARLHCAPARTGEPRRGRFTARITIEQGGRDAAEADVVCTVFDTDKLTSIERRRADEAVSGRPAVAR
jgi:hypothetical protein